VTEIHFDGLMLVTSFVVCATNPSAGNMEIYLDGCKHQHIPSAVNGGREASTQGHTKTPRAGDCKLVPVCAVLHSFQSDMDQKYAKAASVLRAVLDNTDWAQCNVEALRDFFIHAQCTACARASQCVTRVSVALDQT